MVHVQMYKETEQRRKKIMNVKMIERFTISLLVRVKMSSAG